DRGCARAPIERLGTSPGRASPRRPSASTARLSAASEDRDQTVRRLLERKPEAPPVRRLAPHGELCPHETRLRTLDRPAEDAVRVRGQEGALLPAPGRALVDDDACGLSPRRAAPDAHHGLACVRDEREPEGGQRRLRPVLLKGLAGEVQAGLDG